MKKIIILSMAFSIIVAPVSFAKNYHSNKKYERYESIVVNTPVSIQPSIKYRNTKLDLYNPRYPVVVLGHRGASRYAPENTLSSFRKAIELGVDMLELDVMLTRDDQVVVIHDTKIDRTSQSKGNVGMETLSDLKKIDVSKGKPLYRGEQIPTLDEVLSLAQGRVGVNIEIKQSGRMQGIERKVVDLVKKYGMEDKVVISSSKRNVVNVIKQLDLNIPTGIYLKDRDDFLNAVYKYMFDVVILPGNYNLSNSQNDILLFHQHNLKVFATQNNPVQITNMINAGVNGILTDNIVKTDQILGKLYPVK